MSDRIGQQIGNYLLVRLIKCGGFGCVYLGQHVRIKNMQAAIKILHAHEGQEVQEKFQQEAEIIARLKHPNIIRLLDFGTDKDNVPYLIMDYAPGGNLRDRHTKGSIVPLATVAEYLKQIAEALQYAHNHHVNHRDLKPENLLIGENGEILLSDFGISAIVYDSPLLKTGESMTGTIPYMAPEQILKKPRRASDQYALGVILYDWLTGVLPFQGTPSEVIAKHLNEMPRSLRERVPTIPSEVEEIVLRALAKDPNQRFASVQEFANALEQASVPTQPNGATLLQSQPLITIEPVTPPDQQLQSIDLDALYREGVFYRSKGGLSNLEQAASCWQQILDRDPNYGNGKLAPQRQRLLQELHPLRVQDLRQRAGQASREGAWEREISAWNALLKFELQDTQAKEHIPIAEHNQKYAWMYDNAQQLAKEGNRDAVRTTLQELWHDAPYYGDPAGLAKNLRIRVPASYEKTKVITQRKEGRSLFISTLGANPPLIWFSMLCLLSGLGSSVGFLTQSWFWSLVTVFLATVLLYVSGYRKAVNVPTILCIAAISSVIAYGCAWYASTLNYSQYQSAIIHNPLYQCTTTPCNRPTAIVVKFWLINQLWFGLVFNILCSLTIIIIEVITNFNYKVGWSRAILGIASYAVLGAATLVWLFAAALGSGAGLGFGFGWQLAFLAGPILAIFNSIGLGAWVRVLFEPQIDWFEPEIG